MKEKTKAIVEWKMPTVPDQKALTKRTLPLLDQAKNYEIKTEDHFVASWAIVSRHDQAIEKINEIFDPFTAGLYRLHKMALGMRDQFLKPLVDSKKALLGKRQLYRGLQEAAKKRQDEAAAKLLQAQQQKELEKQAKAAEKKGDTETAEEIREQKALLPMPYFAPTPAVPKQEGSVVRKRWLFEILEADAVEREYCSPDGKKIRPVVESLGPACKISGLRIWEEEKEHSRSVGGAA